MTFVSESQRYWGFPAVSFDPFFENELVKEAERTAAAAEFAFKNGAIGVMDLLDSRRTLKAIQIDAANARADHAKALAAYVLSGGGS